LIHVSWSFSLKPFLSEANTHWTYTGVRDNTRYLEIQVNKKWWLLVIWGRTKRLYLQPFLRKNWEYKLTYYFNNFNYINLTCIVLTTFVLISTKNVIFLHLSTRNFYFKLTLFLHTIWDFKYPKVVEFSNYLWEKLLYHHIGN
jgi:hypothetical protein